MNTELLCFVALIVEKQHATNKDTSARSNTLRVSVPDELRIAVRKNLILQS